MVILVQYGTQDHKTSLDWLAQGEVGLCYIAVEYSRVHAYII